MEFTHSSARIPTCFPLIGESEQKMEASSSTFVEEYFSINDPIKSGVKEGEVPCSSGENSVQMPLHEAAARNDLDRVEALLLSGSSDAVNARDCFGMCQLHHASRTQSSFRTAGRTSTCVRGSRRDRAAPLRRL